MPDHETGCDGRGAATDTAAGAVAFRRGLLEPNPLSVGTAAVVCAGLLAALALFVDESFAASPRLQYFAPPRGAHTTAVTSRVLRLARERPQRPQVLVLGSSAVRNAVDTVRLQERLRSDVRTDVDVLALATAAQPLPLCRGVVERVRKETTAVVVLGVGLRQLATEVEAVAELGATPRLGFRSTVVDEAVRAAGGEVPSRIGIYAWDNRNFLAPRLLEGLLPNLVSGPPTPVLMPHAGKDAHPVERYDGMLAAVAAHLVDYERNAPRNAAELERLVEDVAAHPGLELVLVEATLNPEFVERYQLEDERADYRARVTAIAERHGVPFLLLSERADFAPDDFRDAVHLRKRAASRRYTDLLADDLAARMAGGGK